VHGFATNRAKGRHLATPAFLCHHIHIPRYTARAAPERLLGASAGENGVFFTTHGALARHFFQVFCFSTFFSFFLSNGF
jgi:hypothetical protein